MTQSIASVRSAWNTSWSTRAAGRGLAMRVGAFLVFLCIGSTGASLAGSAAAVPPGAPPLNTPLPSPPPLLGSAYNPPPSVAGQDPLFRTNLFVVDICHTSFAAPGTAGDWSGSPGNVTVPPGVIGIVQLHFRLCQNNNPPWSAGNWNIQVYFGAAPSGMGNGFTINLNPLFPFFTTPNIADISGAVPPGTYAYSLVLTQDGIVTDFLDPLLITGYDSPEAVGPEKLLDHYKCYQAEGAFEPRTVRLTDQFGTGRYQVIRPTRLCTPVNKNREGMLNRFNHLVCYQMRRLTNDVFVPGKVLIQNQFGTQALRVVAERELCVPALKYPIQPPEWRPTQKH